MSTLFRYKTDVSRAGIHMYMHKDSVKYPFTVFPYAGVLSSYDLNSMPSNDTMSLYGDTNNLSKEVIKMSILLISLCREVILSSAKVMLPTILIALMYVDTIFPCVDMLSEYGVNVFLDRGNVSSYAEMTF